MKDVIINNNLDSRLEVYLFNGTFTTEAYNASYELDTQTIGGISVVPILKDLTKDGYADLIVHNYNLGTIHFFESSVCQQNYPCSLKGICNPTQTQIMEECECLTGFSGEGCSDCQRGFYGIGCDICPGG